MFDREKYVKYSELNDYNKDYGRFYRKPEKNRLLQRRSPENWKAMEEETEFLHYLQQNSDDMYMNMYMDPDELQYYLPQDNYNNYIYYENDFESPPLREQPVKCKKKTKKPLPSKSYPLSPLTPNSLHKYTVLDPIKSKKDNIVKESINEIKKNTVSIVESRNKSEQIANFNEEKREKMNLLEELPSEAFKQVYFVESPPPPEENREINSSRESIKQTNKEEILKEEKVIMKNIGKFSLRNDENRIDKKVNMPEEKETKDENDINNAHISLDIKKNENEISSKIFGKSLLKPILNSKSEAEDALKSNKNAIILPGEDFQNNVIERENEEKQYKSSLLEIRNELSLIRDEIKIVRKELNDLRTEKEKMQNDVAEERKKSEKFMNEITLKLKEEEEKLNQNKVLKEIIQSEIKKCEKELSNIKNQNLHEINEATRENNNLIEKINNLKNSVDKNSINALNLEKEQEKLWEDLKELHVKAENAKVSMTDLQNDTENVKEIFINLQKSAEKEIRNLEDVISKKNSLKEKAKKIEEFKMHETVSAKYENQSHKGIQNELERLKILREENSKLELENKRLALKKSQFKEDLFNFQEEILNQKYLLRKLKKEKMEIENELINSHICDSYRKQLS
ncbi:synaptonemal complex protein 1-like [Centruroides sculpturatus]|uniref:synaptonemal complex protein 1-like n=1 Tax=Centruroides sculpturatus TaxID=218467 RepID=UPI000C6D10B5|nr:synaptonemal complex protein 1-like [Centruroides sculpturatus]